MFLFVLFFGWFPFVFKQPINKVSLAAWAEDFSLVKKQHEDLESFCSLPSCLKHEYWSFINLSKRSQASVKQVLGKYLVMMKNVYDVVGGKRKPIVKVYTLYYFCSEV